LVMKGEICKKECKKCIGLLQLRLKLRLTTNLNFILSFLLSSHCLQPIIIAIVVCITTAMHIFESRAFNLAWVSAFYICKFNKISLLYR
jgi:hypothetical protein